VRAVGEWYQRTRIAEIRQRGLPKDPRGISGSFLIDDFMSASLFFLEKIHRPNKTNKQRRTKQTSESPRLKFGQYGS